MSKDLSMLIWETEKIANEIDFDANLSHSHEILRNKFDEIDPNLELEKLKLKKKILNLEDQEF